MIEPGSAAPDFTLPDQDGNKVSLADFRGRTVVLVFYPADFSPVCTDQLNVYQEVLPQIEEQGATLVGISVDGAFSTRPSGSTSASRCRCSPTSTRRARSRRPTASSSRTTASPAARSSWSTPRASSSGHTSPRPLEIPGANLIFDALEQRATA